VLAGVFSGGSSRKFATSRVKAGIGTGATCREQTRRIHDTHLTLQNAWRRLGDQVHMGGRRMSIDRRERPEKIVFCPFASFTATNYSERKAGSDGKNELVC